MIQRDWPRAARRVCMPWRAERRSRRRLTEQTDAIMPLLRGRVNDTLARRSAMPVKVWKQSVVVDNRRRKTVLGKMGAKSPPTVHHPR